VTLVCAFLIAGLVLFIIAALLAFSVFGAVTLPTLLGLVAAGLACWIAAALP
jgi:archaellum component FlaG (FlaF/FlaG flagellin family)